MFEVTSEIFYILLLILLGKGYTVTRARLRVRSVVKVTTFMSLYCVTCIALFTYERQVSCFDSASWPANFIKNAYCRPHDLFMLSCVRGYFHVVDSLPVFRSGQSSVRL